MNVTTAAENEYGCTKCQVWHGESDGPIYAEHIIWQSKHGLRRRMREASGAQDAEPMTESAIEDGDYPEDWEEQGWCCRECGVMAWYGMSLELRREFAAEVAARRAAEANRQIDGQLELL